MEEYMGVTKRYVQKEVHKEPQLYLCEELKVQITSAN